MLPQQARGGGDRPTYYTNVGCRLLDGETCRCRDYAHRLEQVDDCVRLTPKASKPSPGCRRPAPTCCSPRARTSTGGIRWCRAIPRLSIPPASRCAAALTQRREVPDEDLEEHIVAGPSSCQNGRGGNRTGRIQPCRTRAGREYRAEAPTRSRQSRCFCWRLLSPPSRRKPIGHAGVAGAVRKAGDRLVAAKGKIRGHAGSPIGQRHLPCASSSSEQRCALSIGVGAASVPRRCWRVGAQQPEHAGAGMKSAGAGRVEGNPAPAHPRAAPATGPGGGFCR